MKTRLTFLFILAALAVGTAHGQKRIDKVLHEIETKYVDSKSHPDAVRTESQTVEDKDGNIVIVRKLFAIHAQPKLVAKLEKAFDAEVGNAARTLRSTEASSIRTGNSSSHCTKRYFFEVGEEGGVVYQMFGTRELMIFTYAWAVDSDDIMHD